MQISFFVTKKDIARGFRENCFLCPVARSMKRKLKGITIRVCPDYAILGGEDIVTANRVFLPRQGA